MTETKKTRRQEEARARLAAARKAQAVDERKRRVFVAGGATLAVVLVIAIIVGIGLATRHSAKASKVNLASSTLVSEVTNIPAATAAKVGTGGAAELIPLHGKAPVTSGGKPVILYVGAEYCPFCAAERWALIQALSRFGTFSNLHTLYSTENHVPTFTFYRSSYTSKYIEFQPEEIYSGQTQGSFYAPLQKLSSEQSKLFTTYDSPPYTSTAESFPFVDFANKWILSGASYVPDATGASLIGSTQAAVAAQLSNPDSGFAKEIDGAANLITAAICSTTSNTPSSVCTAPGTVAGTKELAAAHG
jgi:thiol-disulfide isomerase/thioredoxin